MRDACVRARACVRMRAHCDVTRPQVSRFASLWLKRVLKHTAKYKQALSLSESSHFQVGCTVWLEVDAWTTVSRSLISVSAFFRNCDVFCAASCVGLLENVGLTLPRPARNFFCSVCP